MIEWCLDTAHPFIFFNYARINAGLSNPLVREHMAALFGEERAERLAVELGHRYDARCGDTGG